MLMLAVEDIPRSRLFYEEGLGWQPWGGRQSKTSLKYMVGGVLVTMILRDYLAQESGLALSSGTAGVVLVINLHERDTVDRIADEVVAAGGCITSSARVRDGGLYSFYFLDPDRNPWEAVWNPNMPMDENGVLQASR
jgi:predicted lactoylglutathione lyase